MSRQTKKQKDAFWAKEALIRKEAEEFRAAEKKSQDLRALALTIALAMVAILIVYTASTVSMMDAKIDMLQAKMDAEHSPFCYVYNDQGKKMYGVDDGMVMNKCNVIG